jgi:hypothetical protein
VLGGATGVLAERSTNQQEGKPRAAGLLAVELKLLSQVLR